MPPPPPSGPDEPRALSERERAILADLERDLGEDYPALARAMSRPTTRAFAGPAGHVYAGFALLGALLVLAVPGMIPPAMWTLIAVLAAMVLVPWGMLRLFERFDPDPD